MLIDFTNFIFPTYFNVFEINTNWLRILSMWILMHYTPTEIIKFIYRKRLLDTPMI